ncbi:sensor histidine kinase [Roseomonas gilardii]|uniref:histidine kinase n=1 Tax=Roseomonas gilardii TaxID=257708 RepID=A0ABU3MD12_9PROT|nr:sensor histidine kinase [Roseomonas gilardii]MDT8330772.1 sensor histidine kinase [Roseomonas gilardii]
MSAVRSLHARVAVLLLFVLGSVGACFAVAGWYYAWVTAGSAHDTLLRYGASQIAENTYQQGAMVAVEPPVSVLASLSAMDRVAYKVVDPRGVVVAGSPDLALGPETPREQALLRQGRVLVEDGVWRGEPVRIAVTTRRLGEGWALVAVAQTLHARTALARDIAGKAILGVLLLTGLALLATLLAIKHVLAPLKQVQDALRERDPRDLSPLAVAAPPEIAALVGAIDGFMARLDRRIGMMQRMIGDAAHQIRTPLAGLASQVDLLSVEGDPARRATQLRRIAARTEQLGRLVGQLFNHAMVTHRPDVVPPEPVDLVALARRILLDLPEGDGTAAPLLSLDAPEEPLVVPGDPISLREAVSNLVNNALQHGAASRLEVRVFRQGGDAVLEVVDDGPGIPPTLWARVREPFHPRGEGRTGAGLGLAIADEVVRAHGGSLRFRSDSADGFAVILTLPGIGAGPVPGQRPATGSGPASLAEPAREESAAALPGRR